MLESGVRDAMVSCNNGLPRGEDNIPAEQPKAGGYVVKFYTKLTEEWPEDNTTSIIVPLPQKGDLGKVGTM